MYESDYDEGFDDDLFEANVDPTTEFCGLQNRCQLRGWMRGYIMMLFQKITTLKS